MAQPGFELGFSTMTKLFPLHPTPSPKRSEVEGSVTGRSRGARAFTYGSVFVLQAGADDGAAIQKDPSLGRGHLPTPLELVVQQRVLLEDEPSHLPVVDNVTLRTGRKALGLGGQRDVIVFRERCPMAQVASLCHGTDPPTRGNSIIFLSLILFIFLF